MVLVVVFQVGFDCTAVEMLGLFDVREEMNGLVLLAWGCSLIRIHEETWVLVLVSPMVSVSFRLVVMMFGVDFVVVGVENE